MYLSQLRSLHMYAKLQPGLQVPQCKVVFKSVQPQNAKMQRIRTMWWGQSGIGKVRITIEDR